MVTKYKHALVESHTTNRVHQTLQQSLALHLQQALGPPSHTLTSASCQYENTDALAVFGRSIHRESESDKQVEPGCMDVPSASAFLACLTFMSRGSGTQFFTASTSAMMLTAISGGVLLPM